MFIMNRVGVRQCWSINALLSRRPWITHSCGYSSKTEQTIRQPSMQLTLALLKPDICTDKEQIIEVYKAIDDAKLTVLAKHHVMWTPDGAGAFYAEHKGRFFYQRLCGYMSSGPFQALVLGGHEAIPRWRALIGPTHPIRARVNAPTTLRALYGLTDTRNSFHGSDSVETANKEIKFFFPELDLQQCLESLNSTTTRL
ncbi:nucleoside diphosphate kinase [Syncephalis plumigaleata]|nr:nucleoside diphosphate kinase [Syncephalis plumigaleata]